MSPKLHAVQVTPFHVQMLAGMATQQHDALQLALEDTSLNSPRAISALYNVKRRIAVLTLLANRKTPIIETNVRTYWVAVDIGEARALLNIAVSSSRLARRLAPEKAKGFEDTVKDFTHAAPRGS